MDIDAQISAWESNRAAQMPARQRGGRPPRPKPDAPPPAPVGTIPERVSALIDSMSEHDRERLREVIERATKPQSGVGSRYHLSLEETALALWVQTGRLYSRQTILNIQEAALEKIRQVAMAEVESYPSTRTKGESA